MKTSFLFDLDSTITRAEILPTIAEKIGKGREMRELTEKTMMGDLPFHESFRSRVKILSDIPVSEVSAMIAEIPLSPAIVRFLKEEHDSCYVVTSNLDVWIKGLLEKLDMSDHCFCSTAVVKDNKILDISDILVKRSVIDRLTSTKTIAIGDGNNDYEMIEKADIGISFGGVRAIAPSLFKVSDYSVYDENTLYYLLKKIKKEENGR